MGENEEKSSTSLHLAYLFTSFTLKIESRTHIENSNCSEGHETKR